MHDGLTHLSKTIPVVLYPYLVYESSTLPIEI